ncbi:DNA polymerase III alpha subunit [Candidatus Purcelliella pentastirinorum]|uniref:DNA polymerase III subunit alpha n=1 Tax=Candidatus Purcelliella pentastirinorum TaxID=472834 RepID=A0A346DZ88_9ENTR|nr:DNA polymerase III subunit alpha [Candidatus Purcelliella pentastirinorum]AXN02043.1 DNA polymerase III alpha subunit [Candidatus Purcelliella pentastirinorum]
MFNSKFIHLSVHTDYSIIDGLIKINSLVNKIFTLCMSAVAVTDFNNIFGLVKFYNLSHKIGIKPIIGADFIIKSLTNGINKLTILAKNNIGYKNLIFLISLAYKNKINNSIPAITYELLIKYKDGLIILSGGIHGDIGKSLLDNNDMLIKKNINFYKKYFNNNYYLELSRIGKINEENYINLAIDLSYKENIPVVATNKVRFLKKDDFYIHEIRVAINNGNKLNDLKYSSKYSNLQYLRSEQEMCKLFIDIPEALINTVEISKRCNVFLDWNKYHLPKFKLKNISEEDYLFLQANKGMKKRLLFLYSEKNKKNIKYENYYERLNHELNIIKQVGFSGYFLIVMEFVKWAKSNFIPVGPGRGSGAGSLVAYALGITDIDPLDFNLIFERFLNCEKISLPDFDIDFCMEKRDLIIEHVIKKYGYNNVSQIITFGTMTAKVVIRDVGRVLGYPYGFVNKISKLIPFDPGITINNALFLSPQLLIYYKTDNSIKELIDLSIKLEGIIRNVGKHAGGVVISPKKITNFLPLYYDKDSKNSLTQFDKNDIERIGLIKFDFLGLRTLTIIDNTLKIINIKRKKLGKKIIDINKITLNDKKSFLILKTAKTTAVFQLESYGIKNLIRRLQPDTFEELIALIALYRPGPLQSGMVDNFINRKHGKELIAYPDKYWQHKSLKPILESTYGIILYQEQVMQISQILSDYSLGQADILRRAMTKKKKSVMLKQRILFKKGAIKKGININLAMKIFDLMEKFAAYGFNKSHSAAYALISYRTLWLKANYPVEFLVSVLNAEINNTDKLSFLINECKYLQINICSPNINLSMYNFFIDKFGNIVYGLGAIKGLNKDLIYLIVNNRIKNGKYNSLLDFCIRIKSKKLNISMLKKLIFSGALDTIDSSRYNLLKNLENSFKVTEQYLGSQSVGQIDMFNLLKEKFSYTNVFNTKYLLNWSEEYESNKEKESLGFYLIKHPITKYFKEIRKYTNNNNTLKDLLSIDINNKTNNFVVFGLVTSVKFSKTKYNNKVIIFTLDDSFGNIEIVLLEKYINKYKHLILCNNILIVNIRVKFNFFSRYLNVLANNIIDIIEARNKYLSKVIIYIPKKKIKNSILKLLCYYLKTLLQGNLTLYLYKLKNNIYKNEKKLIRKMKHIVPSNDFINKVESLLGKEYIELKFK